MQGSVSFLTSNNVYVKFQDTKNIAIGDTLYISRDGKLSHCLVVKNKSSMSCAGIVVNGCQVKIGDQIIHKTSSKIVEINVVDGQNSNTAARAEKLEKPRQQLEKIRGNISAASYSSMSSIRDDSHRTMYRLSLTAPELTIQSFHSIPT